MKNVTKSYRQSLAPGTVSWPSPFRSAMPPQMGYISRKPTNSVQTDLPRLVVPFLDRESTRAELGRAKNNAKGF